MEVLLGCTPLLKPCPSPPIHYLLQQQSRLPAYRFGAQSAHDFEDDRRYLHWRIRILEMLSSSTRRVVLSILATGVPSTAQKLSWGTWLFQYWVEGVIRWVSSSCVFDDGKGECDMCLLLLMLTVAFHSRCSSTLLAAKSKSAPANGVHLVLVGGRCGTCNRLASRSAASGLRTL